MFKLTRLRFRAATKIARCVSSNASQSKIIESLSDRGVLRVAGPETSAFLQGLITNDMRQLADGGSSMYTMFLNTKGRVMYDAILYRTNEIDVFYVECDSRALTSLQRHLKLYRVRRKIDVDDIASQIKVWALFEEGKIPPASSEPLDAKKIKLEGQIFPCDSIGNDQRPNGSTKFIENLAVYPDPRIAGLGYRIITETSARSEDVISRVDPDAVEATGYRSLLYKLGVGEGVDDLPIAKALPLESNCDYLNGVSFHKGCYIGQELTARTHHTGVVRKRLMPLTLDTEPSKRLEYDQSIVDEGGKVVGKLKGHENKHGIGLLRISEALSAKTLSVDGIEAKTFKPVWWPQETAKEQLILMEPPPATSRINKDTGGIFCCSLCQLEERYDYKGRKPPFSKAIAYLEDCYIAKDPFSIPNRGDVLVIGSDCVVCLKSVCLGCSLFYCKRFCRICAVDKIDDFPPQLRAKINKDYSQSNASVQ